MLRKGSPGVNWGFEGQCRSVHTRSNITMWEMVRTRFTTNARAIINPTRAKHDLKGYYGRMFQMSVASAVNSKKAPNINTSRLSRANASHTATVPSIGSLLSVNFVVLS